MGRAPCCEKVGLKKGKWAKEEDEILANYIKIHGEGSWRSLPKKAGLLRCGKSCRLRWMNYLRSDLKRGNFSKEEEDLIIKLQLSLGNKWSQIASKLPGRTDNEIKNYWNSHLSRSIQYFHHVNQCKCSKTESSESPESSHKSSKVSTNTKKIAQTTEKTRKIKNIDKFLDPQNLFKNCDEKAQSEFSNTSNVDGVNGSCSLTKFSTSESSCNADHEPGTSKEEAINWPTSPDISAFFKEMDEFLSCETNETDQMQGCNSILGDLEDHDLLMQLQAWMEEESQFGDWGCVDSLWDLDLCGLP